MNTNYWYHGSLYGDIKNFRACSHFGTRLAAIDNIDKYKNADEVNTVIPVAERSPTLYRVEIDLSEVGRVIELSDWGTHNAIALINCLMKSDDLEAKEKGGKLQEISRNYKSHGNKEDFSHISDWLLGIGVRVIKYQNEVEGRHGEYSICVVDQSLTSEMSVTKLPLTRALRSEIENETSHLERIPQRRLPYLVNGRPIVYEKPVCD